MICDRVMHRTRCSCSYLTIYDSWNLIFYITIWLHWLLNRPAPLCQVLHSKYNWFHYSLNSKIVVWFGIGLCIELTIPVRTSQYSHPNQFCRILFISIFHSAITVNATWFIHYLYIAVAVMLHHLHLLNATVVLGHSMHVSYY